MTIRLEPELWNFRVLAEDGFPTMEVGELAQRAGLPFAINASYFSEEGPLGLVVKDGRRLKRPVAHKAAHFVVKQGDPRPRVVNRKRAELDDLVQGFQGFPAIMDGGRTYAYMRVGGRGFDVWEVDRRSAGCLDTAGRVLLLATDTLFNGLTLDELATVMGGLGCRDAMGFDGGRSTALYLSLGDVEATVAGLDPVPVALGVSPVKEDGQQ